jgi:hypothetical protein
MPMVNVKYTSDENCIWMEKKMHTARQMSMVPLSLGDMTLCLTGDA